MVLVLCEETVQGVWGEFALLIESPNWRVIRDIGFPYIRGGRAGGQGNRPSPPLPNLCIGGGPCPSKNDQWYQIGNSLASKTVLKVIETIHTQQTSPTSSCLQS